jgi:putative transposase
LNMLWRVTPTGWVKGVWWDVKEMRKKLKKGIVPKEAVGKANHIIPRPIVHAVWASLKALMASPQWPAVLARAAPHDPRPRRR